MGIIEKKSEQNKVENSGGIIKTLLNWLTILRIPNFFTLPGDVIVGYIIAEAHLNQSSYLLGYSFEAGHFISFSIFYLIFAIFAIYGVGMITNDLADEEEDADKRPKRPIPSGAISRSSAWKVVFILSATGLIAANLAGHKAFLVASALLVLVFLYNYILKKSFIFGPSALGVCRVLAVMTGYFGSWHVPVYYPAILYPAALIWFLYFWAISMVAYYEADEKPEIRGEFVLLFIPIFWGTAALFASDSLSVIMFLEYIPPGILLAIAAVLLLSIFIIKNFIILSLKTINSAKTCRSVGELIRSVLFLQASAAAFLGYPFVALFLILLYLPATLTARKFYSS